MEPRRRYHAFDALRAFAMELGLVLHAGVPYTRQCPESWVVCDPMRSAAFDLLNTTIHAFRMPVFFLMSGFFALLLVERIGPQAFARHRVRRLVLPVLVGGAILVPVTRAVWLLGPFERPVDPVQGAYWPSLRAHFAAEGLGVFGTIWHLWFLEYLILYTAMFLGWRLLRTRRSGSGSLTRLEDRLAGRLVAPARSLWLALPVAPMMLVMSGWHVDGIGELVPEAHMLVYYGIFFVAGTLLHRVRDRVDALAQGWRGHLLVALGLVLPLLVVGGRVGQGASGGSALAIDVAGRLASGFFTCLLLFGVVGAFVALTSGSSARQRYLSDAAYFVYLAHFPLIAWLGLVLAARPWPAWLKFAFVLAIAASTLLGMYHGLIRHGPVGRVLHGPR